MEVSDFCTCNIPGLGLAFELCSPFIAVVL